MINKYSPRSINDSEARIGLLDPRRHPLSCFLFLYIVCILVPAIVLICLKEPVSYTVSFSLAPHETVLISVDTTWFKGVNVHADKPSSIATYLLDYSPYLINHTIENVETKRISMIPQSQDFWEYYLSKNSLVKLHFALTNNATFALVEGAENFHHWLEDKNSKEGVKKHVVTSIMDKYEFRTSVKDMYTFVWYNFLIDRNVSGWAWFTITTLTYDTSGYIASCFNESLCEVEFIKGSNETIVIEGLNPNDEANVVIGGSYTIVPRTSYYWFLFGSIIAILTCLGTIVTIGLALIKYILIRQTRLELHRPLLSDYRRSSRRHVVDDELHAKSFGRQEDQEDENRLSNNGHNTRESEREERKFEDNGRTVRNNINGDESAQHLNKESLETNPFKEDERKTPKKAKKTKDAIILDSQ